MTTLFIPPTVKHVAKSRGRGHSVAVSITGRNCFVMCPHCYAKPLEYMVSLDEALSLLMSIPASKPRTLLVSGGCDWVGKVPVDENVEKLVTEAKSLGYLVSMHVCVVDELYAKKLRELGIDVALIDAELDPTIVRDVRKLRWFENNILLESIENLKRFGLRVFPHVVIGLHPRGKGLEYEVIEVLRSVDIDGLSLVVFTPLPDTPWSDRPYPEKSYAMRVLRFADALISKPLSLGCMRPREWVDVEEYAYNLGFEAIANPSLEFLEKHRDLEIINTCCSFVTLNAI